MKQHSFHSPLAPDVALSIDREAEALEVDSIHQRISVETSTSLGRLYRLDGELMAAEADEYIIHESLAHLPALAHPRPRSALILGGGDGATARELLKHPDIERIIIAELDPEVVRVIRQHIPTLPAGAFDSPRVELRHGDAADSLQRAYDHGERFDLILFDLTEADDPACAHLHHAEFMRLCAASLHTGGIIHVQLGSPFYHPVQTAALWKRMRALFLDLRPALLNVPSYGGPWLVTRGALAPMNEPTATDLQKRLIARGLRDLRHYNPDLHHACQVLPNSIRQLLA